jgi:hypothetical protein
METIKSITTKRFEIKLVQSKSGLYYVAYNAKGLEKPVTSESIKDLQIAMLCFEIKLQELEGN